MNRIIAGVLGALIVSAPAAAADLPGSYKDTPAASVETPFTWAGFYVGGSAGFGVGDAENSVTLSDGEEKGESIPFLPSIDELNGAVFGAHVGFNFHRDRLLIGVEGAFDFSDIDGTSTAPGQLGSLLQTETEIDWLASLVARVGITSGNTLFYGFAGPAWADISSRSRLTLGVDLPGSSINLTDNDDTPFGWTAGVGIEHAFSKHLVGRVQYNHYDFGSETTSSTVVMDGENTGIVASHKSEVDLDTIKVGLSYILN